MVTFMTIAMQNLNDSQRFSCTELDHSALLAWSKKSVKAIFT